MPFVAQAKNGLSSFRASNGRLVFSLPKKAFIIPSSINKMPTIKRKGNLLLSGEKRKKAIQATIDYFHTEQDHEIGVIAAEDILDFFLREIGDEIYNKAISDAKTTVKHSFDYLDIDLDNLSNK